MHGHVSYVSRENMKRSDIDTSEYKHVRASGHLPSFLPSVLLIHDDTNGNSLNDSTVEQTPDYLR